ncbi:Ig-like domain-containing protein [Butyrivibrio sp. JL13D10]|uniref:Ig-like domain-containing protein n=1 Tax=Butyrivibrio sp. JL13D10 TaxID=3236815 RepID=UPI0038B48B1D
MRTGIKSKTLISIVAVASAFIIGFGAMPAPVAKAAENDEVEVKLKTKATKKTIKVGPDKEIEIIATVGGDEMDPEDLIFKTNKPRVADVDEDGIIDTNRKGTAKITVQTKSGKRKAIITVKVDKKYSKENNKNVEGFWVTTKPTELKVGDTLQIKYATKPKVKNPNIRWESSDTSVAEVDGNGKVKAIAPGETIISGRLNGKEGAVRITVR